MKLRIARKIDPGGWSPRGRKQARRQRDKRKWWIVYSADQLARAERRLRKSWLRRSPVVDGVRNVAGTDFFAANRVESRRIRQHAIRQIQRREAGRV